MCSTLFHGIMIWTKFNLHNLCCHTIFSFSSLMVSRRFLRISSIQFNVKIHHLLPIMSLNLKPWTFLIFQWLINKFYNLFQYLSFARMLARRGHWCGRKCWKGRPPYPFITTTVDHGDRTQVAAVISEFIVHQATWTPIMAQPLPQGS